MSRSFNTIEEAEEALRHANETKARFLANMSHEIRTPLNSILGVTEMLMMDNTLSADAMEKIIMIRNSGDLLLDIVNDILDLSKIDADRTGTENRSDRESVITEHLNKNQTQDKERTKLVRENMPYGSVLVVDDNEMNLYVATGLMKPYNLKVDTLTQGRDAVNKIKDGNIYDIIFMDHMMPDMDGMEAVKLIRQEGYNAPIVALTANAMAGQAEVFLKNGFDDFIPKPIDIRLLDSILNKLIRDKQPAEILAAAREEQSVNEEQDASGSGTRGDETQAEAQGIDEEDNSVLVEIVTTRQIDGLDITGGIAKFNDDVKTYLKILRSFSAGTAKILDSIEIFDESNLEHYRISAHSIKGMSLDILANNVGEIAKSLEFAAKSGDISFIVSNNAELIRTARKLLTDIDKLLSDIDESNPKPVRKYPDKQLLIQLRDACETYSMDGVNAAMDEIGKYAYESDDGLAEWLQDKVNLMDYAKISEKLSDIE